MATQYATTKVTFSFSIVHPSNADIRFIGSDNSSDNVRCLRITNNATGSQFVTLELGDWLPDSTKNYTAAFCIVNEEKFSVNITNINISGTNNSYVTMWLHGDRDADYNTDGAGVVKVLRDGASLYSASDVVWTLGAGDGNKETMRADWTVTNGTQLTTLWDNTAHVQYSTNDANNSVNETSDFVWLGISLNVPPDSALVPSATGTIYIHFKSTTLG